MQPELLSPPPCCFYSTHFQFKLRHIGSVVGQIKKKLNLDPAKVTVFGHPDGCPLTEKLLDLPL